MIDGMRNYFSQIMSHLPNKIGPCPIFFPLMDLLSYTKFLPIMRSALFITLLKSARGKEGSESSLVYV